MIRDTREASRPCAKRVGALALSAVVACSLSFPSLAFAVVKVDETELAQGENAVGGGKATLSDSLLDMAGVTAGSLVTDENLTMNFNGGNKVDTVVAESNANVDMNFQGDNEVDQVWATGSSNTTINANGNCEFEEVDAFDNANVTVNVTGENDFEDISAYDGASVTVRGTSCQKKDVINLGEDERDTALKAERGSLVIDHVTLNLLGKEALVGSEKGNVIIDTSKIAKDDGNEYAYVNAGGTMQVKESVIDITGTVHSAGQMTIVHSDMKVGKPDSKYGDTSPYRICSETGITLVREKNGQVKQGEVDGKKVHYVDTDGNDGAVVNLEADGEPAYYRCAGETLTSAPRTGDQTNPFLFMAAGVASAATAAYAVRRREEH